MPNCCHRRGSEPLRKNIVDEGSHPGHFVECHIHNEAVSRELLKDGRGGDFEYDCICVK